MSEGTEHTLSVSASQNSVSAYYVQSTLQNVYLGTPKWKDFDCITNRILTEEKAKLPLSKNIFLKPVSFETPADFVLRGQLVIVHYVPCFIIISLHEETQNL